MPANTANPLPPDTAHAFAAAKQHFVEGTGHFEANEYAEALISFEASLALLPGRVSTLSNLGATLVKLGQPELALLRLDEALARDANALDALSHRGLALADLERYDAALACHDAVLRLQPESIASVFQRSLMLKQLGRYQELLDATKRLLELDAGSVDAWWLQAEALLRLSQQDAALAAFDKLLTLNPGLHLAWAQKAGLLKDLGRHAQALAAFEQALACGGDPQLNGYFIASLTGLQTPSAPPRSYVEGLFDDYAEQFDHHLVNVVGYQAPDVLVQNLKGIGKAQYSSALDLGCGTGLCGPLLRSQVSSLTGVDLSAQMLTKASSLVMHDAAVYDALVQADVADYLHGTDQRYDLLISCDVFIYVGALDKVFEGAARVLKPGGLFCFSIERFEGESDFRLTSSQRYEHSEQYVRNLAAHFGFTIEKVLSQPIRQDQQHSIDGLYVYLVKL